MRFFSTPQYFNLNSVMKNKIFLTNKNMKNILTTLFLTLISVATFAQKKPNIVIVTVDDIGYFDLSCYHIG